MKRVEVLKQLVAQRPLCLALCLNILFLLLCLGIGGIHFGSLDDYIMSTVVTGAYGGEFDPHTLFVNGAYAYFLRPFYCAFPDVGWYFVFELLSVFASFVVFTYFLLKRIPGKIGLALSCILLASLVPDYYLQLAFTQCAAVSMSAGILFLYFGNSERRWKLLLLSIPFFVAGIVFRKEGFLLGLPFLFAVLALSIVECRRIYKPVVGALLAVFLAYYALQSFNNSLFENDEYSYYRNYQWSRATFGDGADYDDDAVYDELEERQMQGKDYRYLRSWIFYDTKVLSLDSLKPFADVVNRNRYQPNYARMPGALFFVVANSFFKTNAWCWALFCFVFFYFAPGRANWYTWGSLGLICLCLGYLLLLNRVVYHVESGIWLYAIVCAIPFMHKDDFDKSGKMKALPVLLFALAAGAFVLAMANQRDYGNNRLLFGTPEMSKDWKAFEKYAKDRPDDVFMLYFNDYKYLATYKDPAYRAAAPRSWENVFSFGYWNINLPGMKKELAERGVQNPIGDLTKDNVFVLETDTLYRFDRFYKVHYHDSVVIQPIKEFGNLRLVKYRSEGGAQ